MLTALHLLKKRIHEEQEKKMGKFNHQIDKSVQIIWYRDIEFEIVERPEVLWVGCLDYAVNHQNEPDGDLTLDRFQNLLDVEKKELINPDWSAAIWINYDCDDKPCGLMFAQETSSEKQDKRYELLTQPGGMWLRVRRSKEISSILFGRESIDGWDYFACGELKKAIEVNGYFANPDSHIWVAYDCHAEYSTPPHTSYAYLPVCKK